jgi:hypothetical protein
VHYFVRAYDQSGDSTRFPRFEPQSYRVNNAGCRITDIQYVIPSVLYAYNPTGRRDYLGSGYNGLQVTDVPGVVTASQNPAIPAWVISIFSSRALPSGLASGYAGPASITCA